MRLATLRMQARSRFCGVAVALFAALAALCLGSAKSAAATWQEVLLYTFCQKGCSSDGLKPQGGVVIDPNGDLWGTALEGGKHNAGVVFDLVLPGINNKNSSMDTEVDIHDFCATPSNKKLQKKLICPDGAFPVGGLVAGRLGYLYGTTFDGGKGGPPNANGGGGGTIFAVLPGGLFRTLFKFCKGGANCPGGASPAYGMLANASGTAFFGTTVAGGHSADAGTVFEVSVSGHLTTLYAFCSLNNCRDGETPSGALISDSSGNLYGTTSLGGANGQGTVFELTKNGTQKVLYSFCPSSPACADGQQPAGALAIDGNGNLYGTASAGGLYGAGVVFKIVPGGSPAETVLYNFCPGGLPCVDGSAPVAGVVLSLSGTSLYGTTTKGGSSDEGVVFSVPTAGGTETLLHTFCLSGGPICVNGIDGRGNPIPDGAIPTGPLVLDEIGNIYGTTDTGGGNVNGTDAGGGTIFELVNPSPGT